MQSVIVARKRQCYPYNLGLEERPTDNGLYFPIHFKLFILYIIRIKTKNQTIIQKFLNKANFKKWLFRKLHNRIKTINRSTMLTKLFSTYGIRCINLQDFWRMFLDMFNKS